jgi:hypothetical protein
MDSKVVDLLAECERIAEEKYDGYFTLIRCAENWKFCFGQPDTTQIMVSGGTIEEVIKNAIKLELLKMCEEIAKEKYDGHFTLMKFTTNWRFCFGQPFNYDEIQMMAGGKTIIEAIQRGIKENCNSHSFYENIENFREDD